MLDSLIEKGIRLLGPRVEVEPDRVYVPRKARHQRLIEQDLELLDIEMQIRLKIEGPTRMLMDIDAQRRNNILNSQPLPKERRYHMGRNTHIRLPSLPVNSR